MDLMNDEEVKALIEKVWTDCAERLKGSIERAIYDDIAMRGRSLLQRVLQGKLSALVDRVVEEKKAVIEEVVEKLVRARLENDLEHLLESHTVYVIKEKVEEILKTISVTRGVG